MKKCFWLGLGLCCLPIMLFAQEVNWRSLPAPAKHLIAVNFGADYGLGYGLAYGRKLPVRLPIVLGTELSVPFGRQVLDDWKIKITGQCELWHPGRFSLAVKPGIIGRRYQSEVASIYNLGAEITTSIGYLRPKWGLVAEVNYDRSFSSHFQHGSLKEHYPAIRDGWYSSTGGVLKFGLKANYAVRAWNVFLKMGKVYGQNFSDHPTLPFFLDVSVSRYF